MNRTIKVALTLIFVSLLANCSSFDDPGGCDHSLILVQNPFPDTLRLAVGGDPYKLDLRTSEIFRRSDGGYVGYEGDPENAFIADTRINNDTLFVIGISEGKASIGLVAQAACVEKFIAAPVEVK